MGSAHYVRMLMRVSMRMSLFCANRSIRRIQWNSLRIDCVQYYVSCRISATVEPRTRLAQCGQ